MDRANLMANPFVKTQREHQSAWFQRDPAHGEGHKGALYRLPPKRGEENLAPDIRAAAADYFEKYEIAWHQHANHGLSSQVCCLNFLMPLARRPDLLSRLIGRALGIDPPQMRPVEDGPNCEEWFVGFEWTGEQDYLSEWPKGGKATRGANATSADAFVRFLGRDGPECLLIEWKYTEAYGAPLSDKRRPDGTGGNETRRERYRDKVFSPNGPVRADLGLTLEDFFWEPFYQLVRQQMLATFMERDLRERTRVLHISPSGNSALHKVTSKAFRSMGGLEHTDAFKVFSEVLAPPSDRILRFKNIYCENLFGPVLAEMPGDPWAS